ncbi:hypothetical protein JCM11641_005611 [Rhodosporidiobolus odoratus]
MWLVSVAAWGGAIPSFRAVMTAVHLIRAVGYPLVQYVDPGMTTAAYRLTYPVPYPSIAIDLHRLEEMENLLPPPIKAPGKKGPTQTKRQECQI